jgi:hypothetical protein
MPGTAPKASVTNGPTAISYRFTWRRLWQRTMDTAVTGLRTEMLWTEPAIPDRPATGIDGGIIGNGHLTVASFENTRPGRTPVG